MMHHTRAVILKKEEWREADWLVTAFSEDFGKIRLLAQGSRKHGAKLQGHLEPGSVAELSFVVGRNGYRLTTARLRFFPVSSRGSLTKLRALSAILVTLDVNLLEEREGAGELFAVLHETLEILEREEHVRELPKLIIWFQVHCIAFLGLLPSADAPESRHIRSLRILAGVSPAALDGLSLSRAELERELAWLQFKLGRSFESAGAVASTHSAIY